MKQSQNSQQNGLDLRNILSRTALSPTNSVSSCGRMPDHNTWKLEQVEGRQPSAEARDGRHFLPVPSRLSQHIPEFRVEHAPYPMKQHVRETVGGRQNILEAKDVGHHILESSYPGMIPNIPGLRTPKSMDKMESGFSSYSPWTLDRLRQRLLDESFATTRGVTAPKIDDELQKRYDVRPYDDTRTSTFIPKDALDNSRPMSASHLTKLAVPVGQMKTIAPMASILTPSGDLARKSSYVVDDQLTVDSFLRSLGLEKYAILFKAEEVDMYSLKRILRETLRIWNTNGTEEENSTHIATSSETGSLMSLLLAD